MFKIGIFLKLKIKNIEQIKIINSYPAGPIINPRANKVIVNCKKKLESKTIFLVASAGLEPALPKGQGF